MKLNTTNTFDGSQLDPKTYQSVEPLVQFVNQHVDQVVRALRNQLTLGDNVKGNLVQASLPYDTWTTVAINPSAPPVGVLPLAVQNDIITGFGYRITGKGELQLRARFADNTDPAKPLKVLAYVLYN